MNRVLIAGLLLHISALATIQTVPARQEKSTNLENLEKSAKDMTLKVAELSKKINMPTITRAIDVHDEIALKSALHNVMDLNKVIATQLDTAIGFWNLYLDNITAPTTETYLLAQVMSAFLGTVRALFLQSSVDQAMISGLIKKMLDQHSLSKPFLQQNVDYEATMTENYWNN